MEGLDLPRLYPITDRGLSGVSHAEQTACLCAGGATFVQLREKHLSPREFYAEAVEAVRIAHLRGARVIVNDRADVALAAGADGVHLGQDDLPPAAARALLGEEAIIGFSTHDLEQARAAAGLPINYLAIGPVYRTASKENPDPVVGLEGVRQVRAAIGRLPLVAIGGMTPENACQVLEAGADSVAVISSLIAAGDPSATTLLTRDFLSLLNSVGRRGES